MLSRVSPRNRDKRHDRNSATCCIFRNRDQTPNNMAALSLSLSRKMNSRTMEKLKVLCVQNFFPSCFIFRQNDGRQSLVSQTVDHRHANKKFEVGLGQSPVLV